MAKADNKTVPTDMSPLTFLATLEDGRRRDDAHRLLDFFNRVTGLKPKMWGPSIIGYGRYHYVYKSGREGDWLMTGFSPRKSAQSIYIMPGYRNMAEKLDRLGKHKTGVSCLYITRLDNIDMAVLEEIVLEGLSFLRKGYETFDE